MYSYNERPQIKASIFYYDCDYYDYYPCALFSILEKYNMSTPKKFYAGSLTKNKYINLNNNLKKTFIDSYTEKDIFEFDMSSGENHTANGDFFRCL